MAQISYIFIFVLASLLLIVENSHGECDFGCGLYYKPICAKDADGNTRQFANDCELSWARCKTPTKKYEVMKKGQCDEKEENLPKGKKTE